jgi:hypothetical protein
VSDQPDHSRTSAALVPERPIVSRRPTWSYIGELGIERDTGSQLRERHYSLDSHPPEARGSICFSRSVCAVRNVGGRPLTDLANGGSV